MRTTLGLIALLLPVLVLAQQSSFTGTWLIDLRSSDERERSVECGMAIFELTQVGDVITGSHAFATPGCGRVNEGGPEAVKGKVTGASAVLVVTSARNGAVVEGKATLNGDQLQWQTLQEIKPGDPAGDSALILEKGTLHRER